MSVIFLAKGTCTIGVNRIDKDGNVVESTPAQFTMNDTGGSIAVGLLDPETMQPVGPVEGIFGDWNAAGYLAYALELLKPGRKVNIPDFKYIIQSLIRHEGVDICDNCYNYYKCSDCIVKEWKEELDEPPEEGADNG